MSFDPSVLASLDLDTILSVGVRVGDLLKAVQARAAGPDELSTSQAAAHIGRTTKWWRQQCEAKRIDGAYLDESGRWRMPNHAAREHLASLSIGGGKPSITKNPKTRSSRRGPRKDNRPASRLVGTRR